jgi:histidine kinase/DNA gyrase B/HSP90-like ATPase
VRLSSAEVDRLAHLAEDLLLIARSDRGKLPLKLELLDTSELLTSVASRFEWRAQENGRSLHAGPTSSCQVRGHRIKLEQALANLVENAPRHGNGAVRLSASRRNGLVELHVTDEGSGFPPEFMARAFERLLGPIKVVRPLARGLGCRSCASSPRPTRAARTSRTAIGAQTSGSRCRAPRRPVGRRLRDESISAGDARERRHRRSGRGRIWGLTHRRPRFHQCRPASSWSSRARRTPSTWHSPMTAEICVPGPRVSRRLQAGRRRQCSDGSGASSEIARLSRRASRVAQFARNGSFIDVALAANAVSQLMPALNGRFRDRVPAGILALDYFDREAELRSLARQPANVALAVKGLAITWAPLRSKVIAAGGARQVAAYDRHVAAMKRVPSSAGRAVQLEAARGLELVDQLENVFTR